MGDLLVLWDVDGTLLNAGSVGGDLYEAVFSSMFGRRCERLAPMAGRTDRAIILDTLEMAGIPEPRRHVDLFIEGLRAHAPDALQAAQRQGRALPGAAEAIAAIASARVAASTIGFAVPGLAIPAHAATPAQPPLTAHPPFAAPPAPAPAHVTFPSRGPAAPASTGPIPLSVPAPNPLSVPAPDRAITGGPATTASAFIAAATLPFGATADQRPAGAATVPGPADITGPPIAAPPAPLFAPADHARPDGAIRPFPYGRRPEAGRVYQSVLTGNVRPLAEVKLNAVGLRHRLDLCIGAYGDDHEIRAELVHLARRRAAGVHSRDFSGEATIVVGDTPLDIEAARTAGARAVGVATGGYAAEVLRAAGAHAVLPDLTNTAAVLSALLALPHEHRRRCQTMADRSVREATWSMTTRRRADSGSTGPSGRAASAASHDGRSTGSSVAGAPW